MSNVFETEVIESRSLYQLEKISVKKTQWPKNKFKNMT